MIRLIRIGIGVALGILAMEALFYFPPVRDLFLDRYRQYFLDTDLPIAQAKRRRSDPLIEFRQAPNWHGAYIYPHGHVDYRTNRDGFRFADIPYEKPPGVARIAFFGASILLSKEIPRELTLPERLEDWFAERGYAVEAMNFALEDTSLHQWILTYRHFAAAYQPDIVVFVDGAFRANPLILRDDGLGNLVLIDALPGPVTDALWAYRAGLYFKLRVLSARGMLVQHFTNHDPMDDILLNWRRPEPVDPLAAFAADPDRRAIADATIERVPVAMQKFVALARANGVRHVVLLWIRPPMQFRLAGFADYLYARLPNRIVQEPDENGVIVLDAWGLLDGRPDSDWYFERLNHFHGGGTAELTEWLGPRLLPLLPESAREERAAHD